MTVVDQNEVLVDPLREALHVILVSHFPYLFIIVLKLTAQLTGDYNRCKP